MYYKRDAGQFAPQRANLKVNSSLKVEILINNKK